MTPDAPSPAGPASPGGSPDTSLTVSAESRRWRRDLRPVAWAVLEDVALDAVDEDGVLVARVSARLVADRIGINPSTAVEALRLLRRWRVLTLRPERASRGRFGLSVYVLSPIPGVTVGPCGDSPCTVQPCTVDPCGDSPCTVQPCTVDPIGVVDPCPSTRPSRDRSDRLRRRREDGQAAFDLGLGDG